MLCLSVQDAGEKTFELATGPYVETACGSSDSMAVGGTRKRRKRHDRVLEPDIRTAVRLSLGTARHEADSGRSVLARTPLSS